MHVSKLPTEIVGELGNVAIPKAAQAFNGEYTAALKEIELLMAASAGSPEGARLDALVRFVSAYESAHFPIGLPVAIATTE